MQEPEEITITMPAKNMAMMFGTIIAANVATVFLLQGVTRLAKGYLAKKNDKDIRDEIAEEIANQEEKAKHIRIIDP